MMNIVRMTDNIKDIYCVIMAGGIGSRFWPWSRSGRPKQFLDITGSGRSMIQETFDRFESLLPATNFLVMTGEKFENEVLRQLPALFPNQVLTEPMRRNTAPAIAYAAYKIASHNPDALMIVTPSDHCIKDTALFRKHIREALRYVREHEALMTIGIKPTFPATGYGYIELSDEARAKGVGPIQRFKEKPNLEEAIQLVESGNYLWNSGMFVWKVRDIIDALEEHLPEVAVQFAEVEEYGTVQELSAVNKAFEDSPTISIDYGVMERADNVCTIVGDFSWDDLGTWNSLQKYQDSLPEAHRPLEANVILEGSKGTLVKELDAKKRVVAVGLEDYLVVDMEDMLFIAPKNDEKALHELLDKYAKIIDTDKGE